MSTLAVPIAGENPAADRRMVLIAFIALYLVWGTTYLAIRYAVETIPPLFLGAMRFSLAGAILYVVMRYRGAERPTPRHWRNAFIVGGCLLLIGNGIVAAAEREISSGVAALLTGVTPLWLVLFDWNRAGGQRPAPVVFAGLGLGFSGVVLLSLESPDAGHAGVPLFWVLMILGGTLVWARASIFSKTAERPASPLLSVAMQMLAGSLLMFLAGLAFGEGRGFDVRMVSQASWLSMLYLTLFGSLIGFSAYIWLLQVSTPAKVSTHAYVNPLIAVLVGCLIGKEALSPQTIGAAALILSAVALITTKK